MKFPRKYCLPAGKAAKNRNSAKVSHGNTKKRGTAHRNHLHMRHCEERSNLS
ncbi:MAG: hypothetical protein WC716_15190 [Chitinophagaceae bacterium]